MHEGARVRVTETLSNKLALLKHCSGRIVGWDLHSNDQRNSRGASRVLTYMPRCIFVKFDHARWQLRDDLNVGVYPFKPVQRPWFINKKNMVKATRKGFALFPDFACTNHIAQGVTLTAAILDCGEFLDEPSLKDMLAAYVALSRVRRADDMLLPRACSSRLFHHGPPPGPHILIRLRRGEIDAEAAASEYEDSMATYRERRERAKKKPRTWRCITCPADLANKTVDFFKKRASGHFPPTDIYSRIVEEGHRRTCATCCRSLQSELANAASPIIGLETRWCVTCHLAKPHYEFPRIRGNTKASRICRQCEDQEDMQGVVCRQCGLRRHRREYSGAEGAPVQVELATVGVACRKCEARNEKIREAHVAKRGSVLKCLACPESTALKARSAFSDDMLRNAAHSRRKCTDCQQRLQNANPQNLRRCGECKALRTPECFPKEARQSAAQPRRCVVCVDSQPS